MIATDAGLKIDSSFKGSHQSLWDYMLIQKKMVDKKVDYAESIKSGAGIKKN